MRFGQNHQNQKVLNLRAIRFSGINFMEQEIQMELDRFVSPFLLGKGGKVKLTIIVGRGLNSKRLIQNKHPVRYYTETYLNRMGFSWRQGEINNGGEGVIVLDLN